MPRQQRPVSALPFTHNEAQLLQHLLTQAYTRGNMPRRWHGAAARLSDRLADCRYSLPAHLAEAQEVETEFWDDTRRVALNHRGVP